MGKNKWIDFIGEKADNFQNNVSSKKISQLINKVDLYDDDDDEDPLLISTKTKKIIESILDNTSFDIIKTSKAPNDEEKYQDETKENKYKQRTIRKRGGVFDTILSFCSERITLQQLFKFSKLFSQF